MNTRHGMPNTHTWYNIYNIVLYAVPSIPNFAMGMCKKLTDKLGTNCENAGEKKREINENKKWKRKKQLVVPIFVLDLSSF